MPHEHTHEHEHGCGCGCEAELPLLHLADEDGHAADYPILDVVPYGGEEYVVLLDVDTPEQDAVMILRIVPTPAGDAERYEGVGDEALMYEVFEVFQARNRG